MRIQGWGYDADGRLIQGDGGTYTRDSLGRVIHSADESASNDITFDGDSQMVSQKTTRGTTSPRTTYYLRSSVLGGLAVAEINGNGQKLKTYIYADTRKIAESNVTMTTWAHEDPVTGSRTDSTSGGYYTRKAEFGAGGEHRA